MRQAIWLNKIQRNSALVGTEINDRLWDGTSLISGIGNYSPTTNSNMYSEWTVTPPHLPRSTAHSSSLKNSSTPTASSRATLCISHRRTGS